jgi:hypothetical protein
MNGFGPMHECEVNYHCPARAVFYAEFRGSLSLVCGKHVSDINNNYDATFYTAHGEEKEL